MSILYWDPHERVCSTLLVCAYLAITCWYGQCRQLLNGLSGSSRWWGWIWVAFCRRDFVLPWREASGRNWVSQDEHKKSGGKNKINTSFPPYKDINLLVIGKVIYPSGVQDQKWTPQVQPVLWLVYLISTKRTTKLLTCGNQMIASIRE